MINEYIPSTLENKNQRNRWGDWLIDSSNFWYHKLFFFLLFRQFHCHNFFFPSISTMPLPQINCHKFFSPPFLQCHCHNFFSSHFQQLGYYNSYFLSPPFPTISATWPQLVSLWALHLALALRALHSHLGSSFGQKEFQKSHYRNSFFSPSTITSLIFPLSHTFSCNFGNSVAEIHSLSLLFQITLNSTFITNKINFL